MDDTLCSVVEASNQPLSIIIVGVGNANFGGMERLDGDKGLLYSPDGKKATRDVVQFVPFRNVNGNPVVLAQQVLAEIPDQLVKYMMS